MFSVKISVRFRLEKAQEVDVKAPEKLEEQVRDREGDRESTSWLVRGWLTQQKVWAW